MPIYSDSEAAGNSANNIGALGDDTNFVVPEKSLVLQNRYVIVRSLGHGGMGAVFLAQDKHLSNRYCVVKKLHLDGFNNSDKQRAMTFFEREAMILSTLKHTHVVSIQDYFQEHGNYFLVMEYVKGDNLQQLLKKRGEPFAEKQVMDWAINILDVLHYLHSHKPPVIYRDIKPSNIMLSATDGIKLVDFGIARPYADQSENTHVVSGGYSPPEQYWGAADLRSDIYALGATMYFLLTGKEPIALQTCSIKHFRSGVSEEMARLIQRATAQDIWLRYQTASEMRQALTVAPGKTNISGLPNYFLLACTLAIISIACAAFVFFAFIHKNGYFHEDAMSVLAPNQSNANNNSKGAILWQIPFEIASLASSEAIMTDPYDLPPLYNSSGHNVVIKNKGKKK
jgi:serine/threonine protein kinase